MIKKAIIILFVLISTSCESQIYNRSLMDLNLTPAIDFLSATVSTTQISLSWENVSAVNYTVEWDDNASFTSPTEIYSSTGTNYDHTSLTAGTTYYYRLRYQLNTGGTLSAYSYSNSTTLEEYSVEQVTGFSSTQYFYTGNTTGPQANTTGFTVWCVILPNTSTSNQLIFGKTNSISSTLGWSLSSSAGSYRFHMGDGTVAKISPTTGFAGPEVGTIQVLHGVCISGVMYLYKNGVKVDGSTSISSIGSSTFGIYLGSFSGGTQFQSGLITAGVCSATGMSDSDVESHYQAILADVYAAPSGVTQQYNADDCGSPWTAQTGGLNATRTGTLDNSTVTVINYLRYRPADYSRTSAAVLPQLPNTAGDIDVMFVGDSRTVGVGGTSTNSFRDEVADSYIASADLTNMNFVGPVTSSAVDPQMDGYTGSKCTNHINQTGSVTTGIVSALNTHNPDIVMVLLGINGLSSDADLATEKTDYLALIRLIHSTKPNARIMVCEDYMSGTGSTNARVENFNWWLWNVAWPLLETEGMVLIKYDLFKTIKVSEGDFADTVHPDAGGYTEMATDIYQILRYATGRS